LVLCGSYLLFVRLYSFGTHSLSVGKLNIFHLVLLKFLC
jgi:hypothetical protein